MGLREIIADVSDPATVMDRVVAEAVALVPAADSAAIALYGEGDRLSYTSAAGTLDAFVGTEVALNESLAGLALRVGVVQRCTDAAHDPRVNAAACRTLGISSMICVPLRRGDQRIGVLTLASRRLDAFGPGDESSLDELTDFVSTVIGAAIDLASVTSRLLGAEQPVGAPDGSGAGGPPTCSGARGVFVANVVRPGAALDSVARERVESVLSGTGLSIALQPIVSLEDGSVVGVEALSRFALEPSRGPDHWFAEAAAVGLGMQLELFAVDRALALLPRLPGPVRMAVNVGPDTFCSPDLLGLLERSTPDRVTVELTEHVGVEDFPALRRACQALRARGAQVSIDDTGAGFASLSLVLQVAPEVIKLDRELTSGIDLDPVRRALAGALVGFGAETGAAVVAEGIETAAELAVLRELGIAYGQGFYLGRPGPVEDLEALLAGPREMALR